MQVVHHIAATTIAIVFFNFVFSLFLMLNLDPESLCSLYVVSYTVYGEFVQLVHKFYVVLHFIVRMCLDVDWDENTCAENFHSCKLSFGVWKLICRPQTV